MVDFSKELEEAAKRDPSKNLEEILEMTNKELRHIPTVFLEKLGLRTAITLASIQGELAVCSEGNPNLEPGDIPKEYISKAESYIVTLLANKAIADILLERKSNPEE